MQCPLFGKSKDELKGEDCEWEQLLGLIRQCLTYSGTNCKLIDLTKI